MLLPYYKLKSNPHIFTSYLDENLTELVFKKYKQGTALLFQSWTAIGHESEYKLLLERLSKFDIKFIVLCPDKSELKTMKKIGYKTILCSHNAFVDENLFYPMNIKQKTYNAVYNSQIAPYKRIELVRNINKLAIITFKNENGFFDEVYYNDMIKIVGKSIVNKNRIYPIEVNKILNQSKFGLILSAEEGGNYATVEYLLAGLPVISTHNIGGRNVFLNEKNSIFVSADEFEISQITNKQSNLMFNLSEIRRSAIALMYDHRMNVYNFLCDKFGNDWDNEYIYKNKLIDWV